MDIFIIQSKIVQRYNKCCYCLRHPCYANDETMPLKIGLIIPENGSSIDNYKNYRALYYNLGRQVSRHMRLSIQGSCSQPWPRSRRVTRNTYNKLFDT